MSSAFHEGELVAAVLRPVGTRVIRVRLVVNQEDPHGFYLRPKWNVNSITGEWRPAGYQSVPVEIIPEAVVKTNMSEGDVAARWIESFTPTGSRKDPSLLFQQQ
jgi:hypothetical protein